MSRCRYAALAALLVTALGASSCRQSGVVQTVADHHGFASRARAVEIPTGFPLHCADGEVEVMLLGTFHFSGSGRDVAKRAAEDVMLPTRQRELDRLATALAQWRPDQVAVEWPYTFGDSTRARYEAFRTGTLAPSSNEVVQVGFRLAALLRLPSVEPIDQPMDLGGDSVAALLTRRADLRKLSEDAEASVQREVSRLSDEATRTSIAAQLFEANTDAALHGGNSSGMFGALLPLGEKRSYPGPEIIARWYERNVLMTHNLYRSIKPGTRRVLVLVGSGHVPPLRHLLDEAPQFCPVSPLPLLAAAVSSEQQDRTDAGSVRRADPETRAPTPLPASWLELRSATGVDSAAVRWLDQNVSEQERSMLLTLLGRLSRPEVVQLLPSLAYLEGIPTQGYTRMFIDSLGQRPPAGAAGLVRAASLLARFRHATLATTTGTFASEFSGHSLSLPKAPSTPPQKGAAVHLSIDASPAETLLAIVETPDVLPSSVLRRLASPPFDALIAHHSQGFYPVPLSREQLALNLSHAASTQPLDLLYMYARPSGFYHFADVRRHAPKYHAMLSEMKEREPEISAYVSATIAPYLPPGTQVTRRVSLFFNDLADGWATDDVAAVPIEYYKDDYPRLFNTMVHETVHAAQRVVRADAHRPDRALRTAADSALAEAADAVLSEGTANFIAPTAVRSEASADSMSKVGAEYLGQLVALHGGRWDANAAQLLVRRGVESGGPFYWLGAAISRRLVARSGTVAIARAMQGDGLEFLATYSAGAANDGGAPLLTAAVREAVAALATSLPRRGRD